MTEAGNKAHELADLRAEQEREAGVAAVQTELSRKGSNICISCGDDIELERRAALPSARRCIQCQQQLERQGKQRGQR
ncbi:TraR/DksA C4-type zinc finger protein [Ochrobactrum teleogrylli]|uniref:TraR/DksA family transcriptional regulator n=1 Tax=Ochrobactrum teleogrylli TaxID=2479765 RepID=A0ABY2Y7P7_9HYPH|nr:TraR/DksA C4-type zinc finger protein [[Ochrobactrum] teleogrylli]TNV17751.1 TraR/DksA family transcriptional regulator [[Ochrobactrum] teleogrylli]